MTPPKDYCLTLSTGPYADTPPQPCSPSSQVCNPHAAAFDMRSRALGRRPQVRPNPCVVFGTSPPTLRRPGPDWLIDLWRDHRRHGIHRCLLDAFVSSSWRRVVLQSCCIDPASEARPPADPEPIGSMASWLQSACIPNGSSRWCLSARSSRVRLRSYLRPSAEALLTYVAHHISLGQSLRTDSIASSPKSSVRSPG